jgi:predicted DCC family thiol-disulfide oxidoreductase YuxK
LTKRLSGPLVLSELQSEEGIALLEKHEITEDSVVLIRNGKPYIRSAAAIRCLLYMKWNWRWMFPFVWIIPLPIRDLGYRFIAKIRHKIN